MLLAIDVGNTNSVAGIFDGPTLIHRFRWKTDRLRTADEYWVLIENLARREGVELSQLQGAALSSVVPQTDRPLIELCEKQLGLDTLVVSSDTDTGIEVIYHPVTDVGADRIVNGLAGFQWANKGRTPQRQRGAIVVDFGTATTLDVVDANARYLGGVIAPGLVISTEALFQRASKLPRVALEMPERVLGTSTVQSIQSGLMHGYCGLVDGLIEKLQAELDFETAVLATGGIASLFEQGSRCIEHVDPWLTLDGLYLIYQRNHE